MLNEKMRENIRLRCRTVLLGAMLLLSVCQLSGCQGKAKREIRLTGIEQMKHGDYAGAVASFEKALELSKGKAGTLEVDVLKYRAEAEYQLADYGAAAHTYGALLQVDGEHPEYYLYRCLAYTQAGELAAALSDYQAVAGDILAAAGDGGAAGKQAAGSDKGAAQEMAQRLIGILEILGARLGEQGADPDTATRLYQQALASGYATDTIYNRMGLLYMAVEDYDGATTLFNQGYEMAKGQAKRDLLFNQAVAYERKSEYQKALRLFERYTSEFGSDEAVDKEIAFLKTRQ